MAFAPGWPGPEMPYSASVPMTRRTLMLQSLVPTCRHRAQAGPWPHIPGRTSSPGGRLSQRPRLQALPGVGHRVDGAASLGAVLAGDQGPDVDDPLPLLAGDPGPAVGVGV